MKKVLYIFISMITILIFTGCSTKITLPVAVVGDEGIMRGTATATMSGGDFQVSNKKTVCSGSYDSWDMNPTITMVIQCNDNRKGIAIVTRDPSGMSGHGRVRMSDGYEADLIFGTAAEAM